LRRTRYWCEVLEGNTEADYQDDLLYIERLAITLHDNLSVHLRITSTLRILAEHDIIGFSYYQALSAGQEDDYIHTSDPSTRTTRCFGPSMRWSISRRIFQIRSLARSHSRLPDWHHTHDGVHLADFYVTHVVNEALDSWIVMYTGRDNKVNVEMESDYSYKIAVDIHEAIKAYGMCTFSTLSSSMWMILIRLKMLIIITSHRRRCRSELILISTCHSVVRISSADNLSSMRSTLPLV
jgi:hypothetical protein